jgi:diacylglycerol kinase family enzyme
MDLTEVQGEFMADSWYMFIIAGYGLLADVNTTSEGYRWMGQYRFTLIGAFMVIMDKPVKVKFAWNGVRITNKNQSPAMERDDY